MDIVSELLSYLTSINATYVAGTNTFAGQMPDSTEGIYLIRSSGSLNYYLPVEETVVDIYAKYLTGEACINNLETIKRHMHRMHTTNTSSAYIYSMLAISDIEDISRDKQGYKIFKFSLLVKHRPLSLIS